ncbi:MAG: hypothetical protein GQ544_09960 [Candidatus Aminicenantes bacterium]|nr:hypothetical protein [Candidatus Aminicenantes bacterium]
MKRLLIPSLLSICLIVPVFSQPKPYSVKLILGTLGSATLEGEYLNITNYWDAEKIRPDRDNTAGLEAAVEFGYEFVPNITLALGVSYLNKGINGEYGQFTHPSTTGYTGSLTYHPEFSTSLFAAYLSLSYAIPLRDAFGISIFGGGGYYFGNMTILEEGQVVQNPEESPGFGYFANRYKSKVSTPGFHAGASFDLNVNEGVILFIEGVYRMVEFKDFDSKSRAAREIEGLIPDNPNVAKNTFMYANSFADSNIYGDILYNLTAMSFKGLEFRGGMKIRF